MRYVVVVTVLALAVSALAQQKQKTKPAIQDSNPEKVNVFVQSWDAAEIKDCSTYDNQPYLLICDKETFRKQIGNAAESGVLSGKFKSMTNDEQKEYEYNAAFNYAITHAKTFYVRFSEAAWPKEPTKQRKLAVWDCTKDKEITCKLNGRD
jgi:hypothetical protein